MTARMLKNRTNLRTIFLKIYWRIGFIYGIIYYVGLHFILIISYKNFLIIEVTQNEKIFKTDLRYYNRDYARRNDSRNGSHIRGFVGQMGRLVEYRSDKKRNSNNQRKLYRLSLRENYRQIDHYPDAER